MIRALVLRAPGINRDGDAAHACRLAGFATDLVHINQLIKVPEALLNYHFLLIPGGFSYGDDLGAGNLLAKNLTIHLGEPLRQFIEEGRPVLGICNGFQVLVRAGLLPGLSVEGVGSEAAGAVRATLTDNESAQFECRWVTMAVPPSASIFTRGIERPLESPIAHGEGQFVFSGDIAQMQANGQVALVYSARNGVSAGPEEQVAYPANPNGSPGNIAGVCNPRGNVMGLMPHPEDYVHALQHPLRRASAQGQGGDGLLLFKNAYEYARQFARTATTGALASSPSTHPLHGQPQEIRSALGDERIPTSPLPVLNMSTPRPSSYRDTGPLFLEDEPESISYAASGVDIAAGEQAVRLMQQAVKATHGPEVLAGVGAFAGVFSAQGLHKMRQPALVASTDGVGT
ncbi:MAG TPA: phosphoribosylformylglycinamidine synthase I, partial [Ktedonosporobacter sp.]|nr:phosphoribosylformylglycinamidine synthase I [Ktedonosporobacter sp.]